MRGLGCSVAALARVLKAAAECLKFAGGPGTENVWRCGTHAVIPGAAPPRPRLGRGRRILMHSHRREVGELGQVLVHSDHCAKKFLPWFDGFDLSFCPIFLDSFGCVVPYLGQGDWLTDWRCI